jgi:hypothetical protein
LENLDIDGELVETDVAFPRRPAFGLALDLERNLDVVKAEYKILMYRDVCLQQGDRKAASGSLKLRKHRRLA